MVPRPHADEKLRVFIAVPLEDSVRSAVVEQVRLLRECAWAGAVRWVRPENFHVTLRFLGDIAPADVPHLAACVRAQTAGLAPFILQLAQRRAVANPPPIPHQAIAERQRVQRHQMQDIIKHDCHGPSRAQRRAQWIEDEPPQGRAVVAPRARSSRRDPDTAPSGALQYALPPG